MKYLLTLLLLTCTTPALAQSTTAEKPLEITAEQTLEWHRNQKQYIARGKAEAKQGLTQINAETLTADYHETAKSNFDIYRMTALENVVITSQGNQAFGDKAVYEVGSGIATMTGKALKMTAPGQTISARDKFEYDVNAGRLSAYGEVLITRGNDKIQADKASAFFAQDGSPESKQENKQDNTGAATATTTSTTASSPMGGRKLERFEGEGHVVVTTPTEILKGDRGVYHADTNVAEVTGNVKIIRGPNVLEGSRAEINLTTNVSKMFGNTTGTAPATTPGGKGRVKGVFYPGSSKEGAAAKPAPSSNSAPNTDTATPPVTAPIAGPVAAPAIAPSATSNAAATEATPATPPAPQAGHLTP